MSWVNQTFVSCQTLTASQMQGLQDDFAALASQSSGAPLVTFPDSTLVASAGLITDVGCGGIWHADSGFAAAEVSSFGTIYVSSGFQTTEVGSFGGVDVSSLLSGLDAIFSGVGSLGMLDVSSELTIHGTAPSPPLANTFYKDNILGAWINFNGTGTIAIRDSFNVSSITDDAVGKYTVTWDTDFSDGDYSVQVNGRFATGAQNGFGNVISASSNPAAGSVKVFTADNNGNNVDYEAVYVLAIGAQ